MAAAALTQLRGNSARAPGTAGRSPDGALECSSVARRRDATEIALADRDQIEDVAIFRDLAPAESCAMASACANWRFSISAARAHDFGLDTRNAA